MIKNKIYKHGICIEINIWQKMHERNIAKTKGKQTLDTKVSRVRLLFELATVLSGRGTIIIAGATTIYIIYDGH